MSYFQNDYKTAKILLQIYAFIGWFVVVIGILLILVVPDAVGKLLPGSSGLIIGIVVGVSFAAFGLSIILIGQVARAVIDNSNANQERLRILKMENHSSSISDIAEKNKKISDATEVWRRKQAYDKLSIKENKSKSKKTQGKIKAEDFKMPDKKFEKDGVSFSTKNDLDKYITEKKAESERNQILEKDDSINIEDFKSDVPGYPYSKDGMLFKSKKEFKDFLDSKK
tara:strand:- start:138 stop:815 length:678 start_codon:yes stop_codon:yes gene_type:complete